MKIIYPNGSGGIHIIIPTGELSLEDTARKDVPDGIPYLLVEDEVVDSLDRADRDAWTADFSDPDGHGGTA